MVLSDTEWGSLADNVNRIPCTLPLSCDRLSPYYSTVHLFLATTNRVIRATFHRPAESLIEKVAKQLNGGVLPSPCLSAACCLHRQHLRQHTHTRTASWRQLSGNWPDALLSVDLDPPGIRTRTMPFDESWLEQSNHIELSLSIHIRFFYRALLTYSYFLAAVASGDEGMTGQLRTNSTFINHITLHRTVSIKRALTLAECLPTTQKERRHSTIPFWFLFWAHHVLPHRLTVAEPSLNATLTTVPVGSNCTNETKG